MQEELQEEKVWGGDAKFPHDHEEPVTSMCVGEYELPVASLLALEEVGERPAGPGGNNTSGNRGRGR